MRGFQWPACCAGSVVLSAFVVLGSALPLLQARQSATGAQKEQFSTTSSPSRERELERGDALFAQKLYADAIGVYQGLLRDYPRDAVLLNKIGMAYQQEQNMREAKRFYERALRTDPKYASAANNLGTVEYYHKRYKKAIKDYKQAIDIDSSVGSFYSNLGYAYISMKQFDPAIAAFRKAIEVDPTIFEQHSQGGSIFMERSIGDRGQFFYYVAKSFAQAGDAERCAQYLRKSRDEGYKLVASAKTDPAFAGVRGNPAVKEILDSLEVSAAKPPATE